MSRATKLFEEKPAVHAPSQNREGYPAWDPSIENQYLQTLLTNTLGNTFYASQDQLVKESLEVHDQMLQKDPEFAARAIVYARNEGLMRLQPVLGLAKLFSIRPDLAEWIFPKVIRIPSDLADFTSILKSLRGGEGGRAIKRVAGKWLVENLNEYWAIKYGAEKSEGYSLVDMIRVYHPKSGDPLPLFNYILGKETDLSSLPKIAAFERLKRATTDEEKVTAIIEGRLPHEVVTPFAGDSKPVWRALVPNLPILALVRHLRTLERHGVLDECRDHIESVLTNPDAIHKSKMFPFQFAQAFDEVRVGWVQDVLRVAVDYSLDNVPHLKGRTVVLLDKSGSMEGRFIKVASLFAMGLMKRAEKDARLILFDSKAQDFPFSRYDSALSQAVKIEAGGFTDVGAGVRKLIHESYDADNLIVITDEQQNDGAPFYNVLWEYKHKVNPNVKTFIVDVGPYRNALTPNEPSIWYIYGWSDRVLGFIAFASEGWKSVADKLMESKDDKS